MKILLLSIIIPLVGLILSTGVKAEETHDNGINTRFDYFDNEGNLLYSAYSNYDGTLAFSFFDNEAYTPSGNIMKTSLVKFVNYGTESYPIKLLEVRGRVKQTWIEYGDDTPSDVTKIENGDEKTVLSGTIFTIYLRIPKGQYPIAIFHNEMTGWTGWNYDEKRLNQIPYLKLPTSVGTYTSTLQVPSPESRELLMQYLPGHDTLWKQSETDPELWSMTYRTPNEPVSITVGTESADNKYLDTCIEAVMRTVYAQYSNTGQQFQSGDVGISSWYGNALSGNFISGYGVKYLKDYWSQLTNVKSYYSVSPWRICMVEIDAVNFLLDNLHLFNDASASALEDARGQLLCLRSYAYLRLLQLYAPRWTDSNNGEALCAPLKTTFALNDPGLSSMKDVLARCYSDLDEAAKLLSGKSRINQSFFSSDVAKGLKMRLALLKEDWTLVRNLAKEILHNYSISSEKEVRGGYFAPTDSWLWGVSAWDLSGYEKLWYYSFQMHNACNGHYPSAWGYSPNAIDWNLYKGLPESDVRRFLFLFPGEDMMYNSSFIEPTSLTSLYNKSLWCNPEYRPEDVYWEAFTNSRGRCSQIQIGVQIKFWQPGYNSSFYEAWFPMMRAEEVLLSYAEAAYRCGNESEAIAALEQLNANRSQGYVCNKNGEELMDEIRFYRDVELWGEGFAWFDYKRWNLPIKRHHWEEGNTESGNWPSFYAKSIETDEYNGWRVPLPVEAVRYNPLIDIDALGYVGVTGYESVSAVNESKSKLVVRKSHANNPQNLVTEPEEQE